MSHALRSFANPFDSAPLFQSLFYFLFQQLEGLVQADTPELRGQAARFLDCLAALVQGREYLISVSERSPRCF